MSEQYADEEPIDTREILNQLRSEKGLPLLPIETNEPNKTETALFKQVLMDLFPEIIGEADYVLTDENLAILLEEFENRLDAL